MKWWRKGEHLAQKLAQFRFPAARNKLRLVFRGFSSVSGPHICYSDGFHINIAEKASNPGYRSIRGLIAADPSSRYVCQGFKQ